MQLFRYVDEGNLATIGRSAAVAQFDDLGVSELPAWILWLTVHLRFLVGFRNRFVVLLQWVWHYLSSRGGARIITGSNANLRWPAQPRRLARSPAPRRPLPGSHEGEAPVRAG